MRELEARLLFQAEQESLRFLPEGPAALGPDRLSWVAIQHGPDASSGSLNVLDVHDRGDSFRAENHSFSLPGRPGFAFPTTRSDTFVVGLERRVVLFCTKSGELEELCAGVDEEVEGTIINDGLAFDEGLVFGTKDLKFQDAKAGLYLWRRADRRLLRLRDDQICSNGKVLLQRAGRRWLLDIDSPTKTVVRYELDVDAGTLGAPEVVLDLRDGEAFPDGMVLCPDERSVIIAFYDPREVPCGQARQYDLETGTLQCVWKTPDSPQVTCPLLLECGGKVRLVLTTAVEHMPAERRATSPAAGALFLGDTPFQELGAARVDPWPVD
jgi:sugar lactone lactonase YvrE